MVRRVMKRNIRGEDNNERLSGRGKRSKSQRKAENEIPNACF